MRAFKLRLTVTLCLGFLLVGIPIAASDLVTGKHWGIIEPNGGEAFDGNLTGNLSVSGTSTLTGNTTVGGTLEVTDATTLTGPVRLTTGSSGIVAIGGGSAAGGLIRMTGVSGTNGYGRIAASVSANRTIEIVDANNINGNYGNTIQDHPTLRIRSVTSAATATNQWGSFDHDTTSFNIRTGVGPVVVRSPINISGSEATPASASATCTKGAMRFDADYIYICIATNTWKRADLTTW
jgi:hypothetical protein